MNGQTPTVVQMEVIPVAGYDSVLMTLSGAHQPCFTRNLVILTDSSGKEGVGEIHGGEYSRQLLEHCKDLVVGTSIGACKRTMQQIQRRYRATRDEGDGIQSLDIAKLKFVVQSEWAVECALLDLLGQYLDLPMADLLGAGKQRDSIEVLGYLFYVADKAKTGLPFLDESTDPDPWFRLRREKMLTPARLVEQAETLQQKYGFKNFKLKGGVLPGETEIETVQALKKRFRDGRISIDPNGCWSLSDAVRLCLVGKDALAYVEDPCGPEAGYSSREIMAEFKNATHIPVATNMIATNWRQFYHAAALKAVDIVLADPHFWGFDGSIRMGQILNDWGLTWGCHSNNHFDITLAAFVQIAAAAPGNPTPLDTHWIWQDGQNLLADTPQIVNGRIELPHKPGLGVTLNRARVEEANRLYHALENPDRDDALVMRRLIPGWTYDSKKPCLVR